MSPIVCQSCSNNMFNHWVVPCNCHCYSFLGNMGGSPNPVAQLTLPFIYMYVSKHVSIISTDTETILCHYCLVAVHRTVKTNFRMCVISPGDMTGFQRRCREYPSFTKNVNFFWFLHWSKKQLIEHAMFHLTGVLYRLSYM